MMAAFANVGKARSYDELERKLREFERLSEEFERPYEMGAVSEPEDNEDYRNKNHKDKDSGLSGAWTITTNTYIFPESYLRLMKIAKEIEEHVKAEMKSEMKF